MDAERLSAALGIAGCVAVLVLAAAPYAVADAPAIGVYYRAGVVGPPIVALFAVVAAIVLLAGVKRRSDPALTAGIAVVVGLFMTLVAWSWALAVTPSLVGGLTTAADVEYHRWLFALAALVVLAAAGWYARTVLARGA